MYVIDDKNFNFIDRIFNVLDGRGISSLPVSKIEMDEKSKPSDTFIANVDQSFDILKNQEFLTFLKKNKFKKAFLIKYGCSNFSYTAHFNGSVTVVDVPVKFEDDTNLAIFYLHVFIELILRE